MRLDELRSILKTVAIEYSTGDLDDRLRIQALEDAALAYAREADKHTRVGQMREARGVVLPFGRSKGLPLDQAPKGDLEWIRDRLAEALKDPSKDRWRSKNSQLIDAIERELETR